MRINVRWMLAAATLLALAVPLAHSQAPAAATQHTFKQIAPGVYSAIAPPSLNGGSNSAVIVNQDDVLVVDSHMTPEAGRVLLQEIKTITNKPVRFLVDTHFHYDHTDGNQAFAPTADIIGHEYTRARLAAANYTTTGMLGNLLAGQSALAAQLKDLKPTPPNVTLSDHLTFWRGGREIRLLYLGRGHTGGDVVVYLPNERVICTGDLLVNGIANLIDGFVDVWPDTLEKLKPLDFTDVIPGHGDPFKGKERIDWFQAYLRDLWKQATALHDRGVSAAEAAKQVDLTSHKGHYPAIAGPGVNPAYMARLYEVIEKRAQ
ncbi:MAG TPA: MBL fold metallo-hydrolase [Vicinamibacterales bacterium]|nr:MBL fold metallo-hydrolase [Vicinamibacterales bacterium]